MHELSCTPYKKVPSTYQPKMVKRSTASPEVRPWNELQKKKTVTTGVVYVIKKKTGIPRPERDNSHKTG